MSSPGGPAPRRGGSLRWVLLGLLLLPIAEVVVLVLIGQQIGFWWTIALVLGVGAVGAWLARRESGRTWRALQTALRSGQMPADEITDTILVTVGGLLLLLPGFLSDVLGLVLVLPFTRPWARRLLQAVVTARALGSLGGPGFPGGGAAGPRPPRRPGGDVIEGEIVSEEPPPGRPGPEGPPPLGP